MFFPKFFAPDKQPIGTLEGYLRYFKESPLDEISEYWLGMFVSRFWRPLRRSLWWFALNVSGDIRARVFGTFSLSVYSGLCGRIAASDLADYELAELRDDRRRTDMSTCGSLYDHRVLDGAFVGMRPETVGRSAQRSGGRRAGRGTAFRDPIPKPQRGRSQHGSEFRVSSSNRNSELGTRELLPNDYCPKRM